MTPEERRRASGAVAKRMQQLGLSVDQLAKKAGIGRSTVRRLVAGETWPRDDTLDRLVAVLEWPQGELVRIAGSHSHPKVDLSGYSTEELARELCNRLA